MGICRDSRHKRRATGGKRRIHIKKRKYELGRPPAMTKLGERRVRAVRTMGGNRKFRALRADTGNYAWGSEVCARKTRILDVVYNASSNELLRTKTLVKGCIVVIDASPFRSWYEAHYGVVLDRKGEATENPDVGKSKSVQKKYGARREARVLDPALRDQMVAGRFLAAVSSRPGQTGRVDGYILEGKELEFYTRALQRKKGK
eukprot:PLAT6947.1.p2 GENE.PLAT6947.1~~PLAT6947.1.p2  ORF type:complete len:203 (+),score=80.17 PLAT6947.1:69-677(+)